MKTFQETASGMAAAERKARKEKRTLRPCLCCRKPFMSEGWHDRLCNRCGRGNTDADLYAGDAHSSDSA